MIMSRGNPQKSAHAGMVEPTSLYSRLLLSLRSLSLCASVPQDQLAAVVLFPLRQTYTHCLSSTLSPAGLEARPLNTPTMNVAQTIGVFRRPSRRPFRVSNAEGNLRAPLALVHLPVHRLLFSLRGEVLDQGNLLLRENMNAHTTSSTAAPAFPGAPAFLSGSQLLFPGQLPPGRCRRQQDRVDDVGGLCRAVSVSFASLLRFRFWGIVLDTHRARAHPGERWGGVFRKWRGLYLLLFR